MWKLNHTENVDTFWVETMRNLNEWNVTLVIEKNWWKWYITASIQHVWWINVMNVSMMNWNHIECQSEKTTAWWSWSNSRSYVADAWEQLIRWINGIGCAWTIDASLDTIGRFMQSIINLFLFRNVIRVIRRKYSINTEMLYRYSSNHHLTAVPCNLWILDGVSNKI